MSSENAQSPKQSVGPDYRPDQQKPTATVSTEVAFENVHVLSQTPQLISLLTYTDILPLLQERKLTLDTA